jgi:Gpi18-like mannosyltransferase
MNGSPTGRYAALRRLSPFRYAPLYLLLFGLLLALAGATAHEGDREAWRSWAVHIFRHGLGNAYALPTLDYNPLYHYILWLYGRLAGSAAAIQAYSHGLKAFTLLFDFAGAILAASLLRGSWRRFLGSLWLLLNAGYLYNTLVWQQVDGIFTCLAFAAVLLALRQKLAGSVVLYVLALNAKLQAIVFLPLLLLLWLPLGRKAPRRVLPALAAGTAVQVLLLAPFIWGGEQSYLGRILQINFSAVSVYPYTSVNAFNIWVLLMPDALFWVPDTLVKFGLSYRHWGLLAFGGASALALLPVLLGSWQRLRCRAVFTPAQAPLVLLVGGLIPLLFCFFNTEMHERYWHPAVLFLGAYALVSRRWLPFALVSVAYFLNLYTMFSHFHHRPTWLVHHPQVVAALFALALLAGFRCLYHEAEAGPKRPAAPAAPR